MTGLFWLAPFAPLLSALVLVLFGSRLSRRWIALQACGAVLASLAVSILAFAGLAGPNAPSGPVVKSLYAWIVSGAFRADVAFQLDPLSSIMMLVVTGVGFLIHAYSAGYMARERDLARYYAALNLFTFFMLVLVLASNMVLMFVGWEGVGLCSYLLIGFWFEKPSAAAAGKKAFLVNRIGDAAFILGILFLLLSLGTTEFAFLRKAVEAGALGPGAATLAAVLLFAGATGKSAQIPLYVWLPDAMEGPTPVSALIHAATMVTAGVYMVARLSPLYAAAPAAAAVVALIGGLTAVFAATIALTQTDIKRVLAYSTISQLGYMFLGCGVGAYAAGIFHLVTHAFFKSLLFLAAGSVIHALSGEQDLRRMGGLRRLLPRTFPTFLIGAIAISGVPFFSGFFSKDAILSKAFLEGRTVLWALGLFGAVLTAFYMFRLIFMTFYGRNRSTPEAVAHLHESPPVMTVPLAVLAFLSIVGGYVGLPSVFGPRADLFGRFLAPALAAAPAAESHTSPGTEWLLIAASTAAALAGIAIAFVFYLRRPLLPGLVAARLPGLHRLLLRKYYVDEAYEAVFVNPLVAGSGLVYRAFDLPVIDGAVNAAAAGTGFLGRVAAALHSGLIKDYALAFLLGSAILLGALLLRP